MFLYCDLIGLRLLLEKYTLLHLDVRQIGGDNESAMNALVQVATRLKANVFEREGSLPSLFSDVTYLPPRAHREIIEDPKYGVRERRSFARGSIYSCGRGGLDHSDSYGVHGGSKV